MRPQEPEGTAEPPEAQAPPLGSAFLPLRPRFAERSHEVPPSAGPGPVQRRAALAGALLLFVAAAAVIATGLALHLPTLVAHLVGAYWHLLPFT